MSKMAQLIMVEACNSQTGAQNNKFYNMTENSNGTFTVKYGRIGSTTTVKEYPIGQWDSKYKEKIKKGYVDHTELFLEKAASSEYKDIEDSKIRRIVSELQRYANASVSENYIAGTNSVTQKQVERVQELIEELLEISQNISNSKVEESNKILLEIFRVIPRKMKDVNHYILSSEKKSNKELKNSLDILIDNEQKTLDVLEGQIKVLDCTNSNEDILQAMGISINLIDETETKTIKKLLGDCSWRFVEAFGVTNKKTQERFDKYVSGCSCQRKKLFWHGSRNENWWSIIDKGLLLRPTNAVITGKMIGHGIYAADTSKKSLGYTSLKNSYWARGNNSIGFMSLFDFHLGNSLKITEHNNWMGSLTKEKLKKIGNYDSVFAQKGNGFLYNNEYVIYDECQCTIRYLVKLKDK